MSNQGENATTPEKMDFSGQKVESFVSPAGSKQTIPEGLLYT